MYQSWPVALVSSTQWLKPAKSQSIMMSEKVYCLVTSHFGILSDTLLFIVLEF